MTNRGVHGELQEAMPDQLQAASLQRDGHFDRTINIINGHQIGRVSKCRRYGRHICVKKLPVWSIKYWRTRSFAISCICGIIQATK